MALRGATGKGASGSRPFVSVIGVARGNTIMKKPTKPKTLKKESHKETVARIAAENRAYFQKLESNGKKQSRKADIVAEITAENRRLYFEELESTAEKQTGKETKATNTKTVENLSCVPRSWFGNNTRTELKAENPTKIRSLFDEYQANNESQSALYVCPHCQNECSVASDLIGKDAQCPHCQNIFNVAATKPQKPHFTKPSGKSTPLQVFAMSFLIVFLCVGFVCGIKDIGYIWDDAWSKPSISDTQDSQPTVAAQPNSQTTSESVADFNSRMEAKDLMRRRAQEDSVNNSTTPSQYNISSDRAEKYFGSAAREEMRDYLVSQGQPASDSDIDYALKVNERLEHYSGN
jgi:hypothetical protein